MNKRGICISSALKGAPREIQVIPSGWHSTGKGDFLLDSEAALQVIEDFNSRENQMVIDYEHQSLGGGIAPAAGWIKDLTYRGDEGLWALVEWTGRARQYLQGCEYRYLSPVFLRREEDSRVVRLINAALTNNPAIDGMVPVTGGAAQEPWHVLSRETDNNAGNNEGAEPCPAERKEEELMQKVLEALGLQNTEGEDRAIEAIGVMRRELEDLGESLGKIREALGLGPEAGDTDLEGSLFAMKQAAVETESLRKELEGQEAREMVALAMKEGKVSPAQKDWAMDYALRDTESFRVFVASAPVVVPVGEVSRGYGIKRKSTVCPVQAEVNRALGLSDERFMKYTNKEEK
jgi:phage I-like protein